MLDDNMAMSSCCNTVKACASLAQRPPPKMAPILGSPALTLPVQWCSHHYSVLSFLAHPSSSRKPLHVSIEIGAVGNVSLLAPVAAHQSGTGMASRGGIAGGEGPLGGDLAAGGDELEQPVARDVAVTELG